MDRKIIISIIIILIIFAGLIGVYLFINNNQSETRSVLVLLVDPEEDYPGVGAVDYAMMVHLKNLRITNMTSIYPTGPGLGTHPTAGPPIEMTNLQINSLYLHDSLYNVPLNEGVKHAQEIVEYNKGLKTDSVVIIKPQAVDAVLQSIGGVDINGTHINDSVIFLREEQNIENQSRTEIVGSMIDEVKAASKNSTKRDSMVQTVYDQYSKGNIIVFPDDLFFTLISSQGLSRLFG